MDFQLKDKTAIVAGGGRGIGKAIARELALEGVDMVIASRTMTELQYTADELSAETGRRIIPITFDVTNRDQVNRAVSQAADVLGSIHILVNSASLPGGSPSATGPIETVDDTDLLSDFDVKYVGALRCARSVIPFMKTQEWGRIINIAGMMAFEGHAGYSHISASKMGLVGLTRSLAVELADHNILVNCISPGTINTVNPNANTDRPTEEQIEVVARRVARVPLGRLASSDEIAALCVFLASPGGGYISGQTIHVNGAADRR